jgi:hypothetical protein
MINKKYTERMEFFPPKGTKKRIKKVASKSQKLAHWVKEAVLKELSTVEGGQ